MRLEIFIFNDTFSFFNIIIKIREDINNMTEDNIESFSSLHRWLIVLTASLCFYFNLMQVTICNSLGSYFTSTLSIDSPVVLGSFTAIYLYATMIFLFPAGYLVDRVSVKKLAAFFIAVSALSNIALAFTNILWLAFVFRFLAGIAGAFSFLVCLKLAPMWFSSKKLGSVIGVCVTIGMCGGLTAQFPLQWVMNTFGGRAVLILTGIIGLIIFLLVILVVKEHPVEVNETSNEKKRKLPIGKIVFMTFLNKQTWLASLYIGLINLPIMILGAVWGIKYLTFSHNLSSGEASMVTSMIFVGAIFGMTFFGWFSDKLKNRKLPMFIGGILALIIILAIIIIQCSNMIWLISLFFILGFITSSQVIGYPVVTESNSSEIIGSANALCNIIVFAVAAILQPFFGLLVELFSKNNSISVAYTLAMYLLPVCFVFGIFYTFLMKESFKKN